MPSQKIPKPPEHYICLDTSIRRFDGLKVRQDRERVLDYHDKSISEEEFLDKWHTMGLAIYDTHFRNNGEGASE